MDASWWCRTGSCSARLMHTPTPLALGVLVALSLPYHGLVVQMV